MGNKNKCDDADWTFHSTKLGWYWELRDADGDLIGRSAMSFPAELTCRENALAHSKAKPPVIDEHADDPPLDVDDIRANIRLLEEWRATKEHARLTGFAEGIASSFKHHDGQRDVPQTWYVYIFASGRGDRFLIETGTEVPGRIVKLHGKSNSGVSPEGQALVLCERHDSKESAMSRQKEMRRWSRQRKIGFIEASNPGWHDISEGPAAS